jgi:RNA polymerase-binding transcription factor DksA
MPFKDPEKKRECSRKWRVLNQGKIKADRRAGKALHSDYSLQWYHKNKVEILAKRKLHRQQNPRKYRTWVARSRHKRLFSDERRSIVKIKSVGIRKCIVCGITIDPERVHYRRQTKICDSTCSAIHKRKVSRELHKKYIKTNPVYRDKQKATTQAWRGRNLEKLKAENKAKWADPILRQKSQSYVRARGERIKRKRRLIKILAAAKGLTELTK